LDLTEVLGEAYLAPVSATSRVLVDTPPLRRSVHGWSQSNPRGEQRKEDRRVTAFSSARPIAGGRRRRRGGSSRGLDSESPLSYSPSGGVQDRGQGGNRPGTQVLRCARRHSGTHLTRSRRSVAATRSALVTIPTCATCFAMRTSTASSAPERDLLRFGALGRRVCREIWVLSL